MPQDIPNTELLDTIKAIDEALSAWANDGQPAGRTTDQTRIVASLDVVIDTDHINETFFDGRADATTLQEIATEIHETVATITRRLVERIQDRTDLFGLALAPTVIIRDVITESTTPCGSGCVPVED